jgi:AmiR/NasT family two-component response regulator
LNSRVIIEQAKGVLAQRGDLSMNSASDRLRSYARSRDLCLSEVARQVIDTDRRRRRVTAAVGLTGV